MYAFINSIIILNYFSMQLWNFNYAKLKNAALFWKIHIVFSYSFPYSQSLLVSGLLFIYKTFLLFCLQMLKASMLGERGSIYIL